MNLLVFVLVCVSICLLFGVNSKDLQTLLRWQRKPTLKQKIKAADSHNQGFVAVQLAEIRQILAIYNLPGGIWLVYAVAVGLSLVGLGLSSLMDNLYLSFVFVPVFGCIPFIGIKLYWLQKEKQMIATLESALNSITSSYLRADGSFISAVEENIDILPSPIDQVFRHFLNQVTYIDSSISDALEEMKLTVHNKVFHQWIDTLIQAQNNQNVKKSLSKVLGRFSDIKNVESEIKTILNDSKNSYLLILITSICLLLVLCFSNEEWKIILTQTQSGKILVAIYFAGITISSIIAYFAYQQSIWRGE